MAENDALIKAEHIDAMRNCDHCGESLVGDEPLAELGRPDYDGSVLVHQEPCAVVMMRDGWEIA